MMNFICIKQHLATFEARLMWNLSNIKDELKKRVPYKKSVNFVGTSNYLPSAVDVKACLIFLFHREFEVAFVWIVKKISFAGPDFMDCEIVIWGLTSLSNFYKRVHVLLKNWLCQMCQLKLLLVANQLLDSTFYLELTASTFASVNYYYS